MVGESLGKKFDKEEEESDEEKHYYKRDKSRKRRGKRWDIETIEYMEIIEWGLWQREAKERKRS